MATKKMKQERVKTISCLGVLLIICMLLVAACTVTVNLLFKNGNAPKIGSHYYCYYTEEDMGERVPSGSLVIADETDLLVNGNIVLYKNTSDDFRIADLSLVLDSTSTSVDAPSSVYYLTTATNPTAVAVSKTDILAVCTRRSPELGILIGFLLSPMGIAAGLILPCLIMLLYLCAAMVAAKEAAEQEAEQYEEADTDLAFVKSIQKKQQEIAERDAERHAKEAAENAGSSAPVRKQPRRLTDEELAKMEEEEAARRAERIAAVRSHMEQRRQSDMPDGVPLYTTEIITKTHTLTIPKAGDKPLTTTQQRSAVKSGVTGQIPKPVSSATESQKTAPQIVKPVTAPVPTPAVPKDEPHKEAAAPAVPDLPAAEEDYDSPIASASFEDLMAFLDSEEEKLQ